MSKLQPHTITYSTYITVNLSSLSALATVTMVLALAVTAELNG